MHGGWLLQAGAGKMLALLRAPSRAMLGRGGDKPRPYQGSATATLTCDA